MFGGDTTKVNTKARRLGYLKLLINFLTQDDGKHGCITRFAHFASGYEPHLKRYKDTHGEITVDSNPRSSAKPYVDLAEDLRLIEKRNKQYFLTEHFSFDLGNNPFELTKDEIEWFLEFLLKQDTVGLFLLFVMTSDESSSYQQLSKIHDLVTLDLIDRLPKGHFLTTTLDTLAANTDNKLAKDSFLLPRLHWFFDLNLLDLKYTLSKSNRETLSSISLLPNGLVIKSRLSKIFDKVDQLTQPEFEQKMKLAIN